MQNFIRSINYKLTGFIISIALILSAALVFQLYMLSRQKEDARLIRLAGRQSTHIQQLTKLSLYIENDLQAGDLDQADIQTLKQVAQDINRQQAVFLSFRKTTHSSTEIDSILTSSTEVIELVNMACNNIRFESPETIRQALSTLHEHDDYLSVTYEHLLLAYQSHADQKMNLLKNALYVLGISVFVAIGFGFAYILWPSVKGLRTGSINLEALNEQLRISNEKLSQAQRKTNENLEKIQQLHDDLAIKENQYRRLIDSADNMIYELDEDGRFIFVNPITESITGYPKGELYDKLFWEIVHPNHKDAAIQFYFQQRKKKQDHSYYELPIVTAKRKTIWIGQSVNMYFSENDGLIKLSIISRDVTNLKMTQLKLENSEKLYRLISTNSRDLVSLYNYVEDTPIRTYVSPSVKDILGYTPEELIGKVPFDMMVREDAERMKKNFTLKSDERKADTIRIPGI